MTCDRLLRLLFAVLALACAGLAQAAVPHEDAVPAYAEEQTILQQEKDVPEPGWLSSRSGRNHFDRNYLGRIGRDTEQDLILQRGGNTWRYLRNGPLATLSGAVLLVTLLALAALWRFVGPLRTDPDTGRRIVRFSAWDRLVHWTTAIAFLVLAFTGLVILFGKKLLLPLLGHDVFSWLAIVSKYLHNFAGPFFILCTVVMFFTFVRRNFWRRVDWHWVKRGGGLLTHEHVPAGFFNAGEKAWFWGGVVLLGLVVSITGLVLDFPNASTRYMIQIANVLHLLASSFYMAFSLGHIYLGTLGSPGAYHAMRHGTVDESWARAHHSLWYEDLQARGGLEEPTHVRAGPHGPGPAGGLREGT